MMVGAGATGDGDTVGGDAEAALRFWPLIMLHHL